MNSLCIAIVCLASTTIIVAKVVDFDPNVDLLRFLMHFEQHPDAVDTSPAKSCDAKKCRSPGCRCSGDDIPRNLTTAQTPQMVIITVQNAVHDHNVNLYLDLFMNRTNPDKRCNARGTFFVSNQWSCPYAVQLLARQNHEIAMNGAKDLGIPWWVNASVTEWVQQIKDNREILSRYSNIPASQITGFRVPSLQMCGNTQFQDYKQAGVCYDGTRVSLNYPNKTSFLWPYTYDYKSTQDCPIGVCPNTSFPGVWQMPLQAIPGTNGVPCSAVRACKADNETQVFNILKEAFDAKYNHNRAPLMLSFDEEFFRMDFRFNGLSLFLDYVHTKSGAYMVSVSQALAWMKNPKPVTCGCNLFPCPDNKIPLCKQPRACAYDIDYKYVPAGSTGIVYVIDMCASSCPACYPRFGDAAGTKC